MKKLLLRSLLKKHLMLCMAMALLCAFSFGLMVGSVSFSRTLENALYDYVEDYHYADGVISVNAAYSASAKDMRELPGVEAVNTRLFLDTVIRTADGRDLAVRTFSRGSNDFTRFFCWDGTLKSGGYYLEKNFADTYGISVGDTFSLLLGSSYQDIKITAIVSSPETLSETGTNNWGTMPALGYLYYSSGILRGSPYASLCNQFLLDFSDDAVPEAVLESACEILRAQGLTITQSYVFKDSPVMRAISNNVPQISAICTLIPWIFFCIVLAVLAMCMAILVRHSRREIGILRALGRRTKDVLLLLSLLMAGTTAVGVAAGFPIAMMIQRFFGALFFDFFRLPQPDYRLGVSPVLVGVAATMLIPQLAVLSCGAAVSSVHPTDAIRREAPAKSTVPVIVRVFFRSAPPIVKFHITTLFRFTKRFVFSVLCIAATVMMIFAALSLNASIDATQSQLFEERFHFDYLAYFRYRLDDETMEHIRSADGISGADSIAYYEAEISFGGKTASATVAALPIGTELITIPDVTNSPESGIVLEKFTADLFGASVGDTVEVNGVPLTVAGVSYQYTAPAQYISPAQAEALGSAEFTAVMLRADSAEAVSTALQDVEGYLFLTSADEIMLSADRNFIVFITIANVLLAFAVAVGLVIVLITARTALNERRREICVMRATGFTLRTVSVSWLIQSLIQFLFGCVLGLPSGVIMSRMILKRIATYRLMFPYVSGAKEFLLSVLLLALYLLIGHTIALHAVRKWNLADAVRSNE